VSPIEIASGLVAIALLGYLVYALLFAERF
jgi:K+-transporting ATPase KdpF subunit